MKTETLLEQIRQDREAGTPQVWSAEKNACCDINGDGWALVWDKIPGGRKNDNGTITFSVRFPMLLASEYLAEPERSMKALADALNAAERIDELEAALKAADALTRAIEAADLPLSGTSIPGAIAAFRKAREGAE
ncbi:hypothetical protein BV509_00980 [Rhodovulum sulfidophilum]|uniref:Ead/Ea22-like family protein n=1 Tax=Rhodovulum visakhapatnamense TaxID=364297 RepID=A0ABS1RFN9_9RHOB|nr:hypothetical protein [Rhodovulum visakhapatnamense]MBL3569909.1 hypothetical protein [Rhodovulum visakhapatnamense]MBL3578398.1 hypothetical protein [Rhodovulum visakhapatnamense]OLS43062.1 hypothetical protein BV509_00980 [Rhodovulum sulfidophilum]